jgi:hypothetical protein
MISFQQLLVPASFFLLGLAVRYSEDLRKHRTLSKEYRRCLRNLLLYTIGSALVIGILIGLYLFN